jgi:hypothetical protein
MKSILATSRLAKLHDWTVLLADPERADTNNFGRRKLFTNRLL